MVSWLFVNSFNVFRLSQWFMANVGDIMQICAVLLTFWRSLLVSGRYWLCLEDRDRVSETLAIQPTSAQYHHLETGSTAVNVYIFQHGLWKLGMICELVAIGILSALTSFKVVLIFTHMENHVKPQSETNSRSSKYTEVCVCLL
jgi:hypothetical protein